MVIDIDRDIYISEGLSDKSEGNSDGPKNGGRKTTVTKKKKKKKKTTEEIEHNQIFVSISKEIVQDLGIVLLPQFILLRLVALYVYMLWLPCPRVRVGGHVCVACRQ